MSELTIPDSEIVPGENGAKVHVFTFPHKHLSIVGRCVANHGQTWRAHIRVLNSVTDGSGGKWDIEFVVFAQSLYKWSIHPGATLFYTPPGSSDSLKEPFATLPNAREIARWTMGKVISIPDGGWQSLLNRLYEGINIEELKKLLLAIRDKVDEAQE